MITGARQVGKTTLLHQLEEEIKKRGESAYFLNLEDMDLLVDFNESPKNLLNLVDLSSDPAVFIDEIQYLKNPSNFLKYLYDAYHDKMRLVVTGSSAFYLNEKFKDSLAGRKRVLVMPTFSFREFLFFKEKEKIGKQANKGSLTKTAHRELLTLFEEFATFGGYPEVVVTPDKEEKRAILREITNAREKGAGRLRSEYEKALEKLRSLKEEYLITLKNGIKSLRDIYESDIEMGVTTFREEYLRVLDKINSLKSEYLKAVDNANSLKDELTKLFEQRALFGRLQTEKI